MNLYQVNLAAVAARDGAAAYASDTENTILRKWASALSGVAEGGSSHWLLCRILFLKTGTFLMGYANQRILALIVEDITGVYYGSYSMEMLLEIASTASSDSGDALTLIGSDEPFTLIGGTEPLVLI